jgi:hypothetical protein
MSQPPALRNDSPDQHQYELDLEDSTTSQSDQLSTSFLVFSSSVGMSLDEKRSLRPQWSWTKYLCWIFPMVWTGSVYFSQLIIGFSNILVPEIYILAIYNIVAGALGLLLVSAQVYDNYYYIKPSSWITEADLLEPPRTKCQTWSAFLFIQLLDMILFLWTIFGSLWALNLYGTGLIYQPALVVFSIVNLALQWSKYGAVMFFMKMSVARAGGLQLLRTMMIGM